MPLPGPISPNTFPLPEFMFEAKPEFQYKEKGMMTAAGMGGGIMQTNMLGTNMKISGVAAFVAWRSYYFSRQFSVRSVGRSVG